MLWPKGRGTQGPGGDSDRPPQENPQDPTQGRSRQTELGSSRAKKLSVQVAEARM